MKDVTISVDEETHRKLESMAAEQGTTISAMLRDQVMKTPGPAHQAATETEKHRRELSELLEEFDRKGIGVSTSDNLSREEIYQANAAL